MPRRERRSGGIGLMVGLLLFVSLNAAFMAGVAMSPGIDPANLFIARSLFVMLSICSVMFASALFRALFGGAISRRRWRRFNDELETFGFHAATSAEVEHTSRLPVHLLAPSTIGGQRGGGIDHVMVGSIGGQEVRSFNVRVRGGGWVDVPAVALRVGGSFAHTVISPAKRGFRPRPGMKRVLFEQETFNRSTLVFSQDAFFASAMIDARMMDWLADLDRTTIELADRWMVAWAISRRGRRVGPTALLDLLVAFDRHVPRSIPSLFPERPVQMLWPDRSRNGRTQEIR
jgi:hypothetical protein